VSETDATTAAGEEAPAEEAEERDAARDEIVAAFTEALGERVLGTHVAPGREAWVRVAPEAWVEAAELARDRLGCRLFDFLSAIDWMPSPWGRYEDTMFTRAETNGSGGIPAFDRSTLEPGFAGGDERFQVLCRLVNLRTNLSVVLKVDVSEDDMRLASLVPVFAGANWHERECWEMFGIDFAGHPHVRHLYLPGGFEGHPLRKDFPLLARMLKPWPGVVDVEPMPEPAADQVETEAPGSPDAVAGPGADERGTTRAGGGGEATSPEAEKGESE
jgi:NADH-quinone oxidoreductase subunit C